MFSRLVFHGIQLKLRLVEVRELLILWLLGEEEQDLWQRSCWFLRLHDPFATHGLLLLALHPGLLLLRLRPLHPGLGLRLILLLTRHKLSRLILELWHLHLRLRLRLRLLRLFHPLECERAVEETELLLRLVQDHLILC